MDISDKKTVLDDSASIYQRREEKTDRAKWKELKGFKVEYSGSGDVVTYQSPSSGESIYEGETIRLLLTE